MNFQWNLDCGGKIASEMDPRRHDEEITWKSFPRYWPPCAEKSLIGQLGVSDEKQWSIYIFCKRPT